jgi:hypothetical protein
VPISSNIEDNSSSVEDCVDMDGEAKKIKVLCGVVAPAIAIIILLRRSVAYALDVPEAWRELPAMLTFTAMIFSPFLFYLLVVRTSTFALVIGGMLVAISSWTLIGLMTSTSSTAGLIVLWIPHLGYPIVAVGGFLDWLSRGSDPSRPSRPRRWHVEVRGKMLEVVRRASERKGSES